MYVFIDESGIHKSSGASTVALVFMAVENTDKLNKVIEKVEKDLRITTFHWARHIWKIRQEFLQALINEDFLVKVALIKNPFTESNFEMALGCFLGGNDIKKIIIDGHKPKRYVLRLKQVLRKHGLSVKKLRMGDDLSFPCLRLADLFAGLTRYYYEQPNNKNSRKLYLLAKNKITTHYMGGQVSG